MSEARNSTLAIQFNLAEQKAADQAAKARAKKAKEIFSKAELILTKKETTKKIKLLARKMRLLFQDAAPILLTVLKGGAEFGVDLGRALKIPLEKEFITISSYGSDHTSKKLIVLSEPKKNPETGKSVLFGRTIIIADDICDSAKSLAFVKKYCEDQGALGVFTAVMIDKPFGRKNTALADFNPDFCAHPLDKNDDRFLDGRGLDEDGFCRNEQTVVGYRPSTTLFSIVTPINNSSTNPTSSSSPPSLGS